MLYFGALIADLTVVPVDEEMDAAEVARIALTSEAKLVLHHEEWEY